MYEYTVALNQCKTTISAHLLGSSMILEVFHYFPHILSSIQQSLPYGCIFFPSKRLYAISFPSQTEIHLCLFLKLLHLYILLQLLHTLSHSQT